MFRKFLLAYDGSADSREAPTQARSLAAMCGATIRVVAIIDYTPGMLVAEGISFVPDDASSKAVVEAGMKRLTSAGCEATNEVRYGNPAEQIIIAANEMKADLIVIGYRDQGTLSRWFNGSVGQAILHHPPCSLLVAVKPEQMKTNITPFLSAS